MGICKGDSILLLASGRSAKKDNVGIYAQYIAISNLERCQLYSDDVTNFNPEYKKHRQRCQWRIAARYVRRLNISRLECNDLIHLQVPFNITNKFPPFPPIRKTI